MICPSVTTVDLPHLQHNWFAPFTTVDLSSQKELDADTKAVQQIKFVGQLKILNADTNVEFVFVLTILEKIKVMRLKLSQGSVILL